MLNCLVKTRYNLIGFNLADYGFCLSERPQVIVSDYKTHKFGIDVRDGDRIKKLGLNDKVINLSFNALEDFSVKPKLRKVIAILMDATEIILSDEDLVYTVKETRIGSINNEHESYAEFTAQCTVAGYEKTQYTKELTMQAFKTYAVDNKGTYKTWPKIKVKFKSDCGYLSLASPQGLMQIGNFGQADKVYVGDSELLLNEELDPSTGGIASWSYANIDPLIFHRFAGSFGGLFKTDEWGISLIDVKTTVEKDDKGREVGMPRYDNSATIVKKLNADKAESDVAQNFVLESRLRFEEPKSTETQLDAQGGAMVIGVMDENQVPLVFMSILDVNVGPTNAQINFAGYSAERDERISLGWWADKNHEHASRNLYGAIKITKKGNVFTFDVHNTRNDSAVGRDFSVSYTNNELAQRNAKYGFIYMGQRNGQDLRQHMGVTAFKLTKLHSSSIVDIRNPFMENDELLIDHDEGTITLNDFPYNETVAIGSRFWWLEPGINEVRADHSEWATPPEISMTYKENWR